MSRNGTRSTTPIRHDLVAATLAAAAAAITMNATAAVDTFAKIGNIKGESQDDKHKDQIDVLSWSWGVVDAKKKKPGACGLELAVDKRIDAATPALMLSAVQGNVIPLATLTVRKSGANPVEFLMITMNDVIITSVTPSVGKELVELSETMTLAYASATISYSPTKPDGTLGPAITATVPASCPPP